MPENKDELGEGDRRGGRAGFSFGRGRLNDGTRYDLEGDRESESVREVEGGCVPRRPAGHSIRGGGDRDTPGNARGLLGFAPIARRIMLSMMETVLELIRAACPLTACTPARPL